MRRLKGRIMTLQKHSEFLLNQPMIYFGIHEAPEEVLDEIEECAEYCFDWPCASLNYAQQNAGLFFDCYPLSATLTNLSGEQQ